MDEDLLFFDEVNFQPVEVLTHFPLDLLSVDLLEKGIYAFQNGVGYVF